VNLWCNNKRNLRDLAVAAPLKLICERFQLVCQKAISAILRGRGPIEVARWPG
jgi:hypothetical protein